jgi:hypothetical protein
VVCGLQVASQGEVDQQRQHTVVQPRHGWDGTAQNGGVSRQMQQQNGAEGEEHGEHAREADRQNETVEQPAVGLGLLLGAERLGDECVETEQDAADAEAECVEDHLRERGGGHGERRVRQVAEHHRIHQRHGDPAEFARDERQGELEQRRQFAAEVIHAQAHR